MLKRYSVVARDFESLFCNFIVQLACLFPSGSYLFVFEMQISSWKFKNIENEAHTVFRASIDLRSDNFLYYPGIKLLTST
jgi:hypothetical protein